MESTFKKIKTFFRYFDIYGESITFKYKDEDHLSTVLGGLFTLIFYIFSISYFIYSCIPFFNDENFNLLYYTVNLNDTEEVKLAEAPTAFAFGLSCDAQNENPLYNISDLLGVKVQFRQKKNNFRKSINLHPCTSSDFHNLHNETFYNWNITNFNCLPRDSLLNDKPAGIYTDDKFSYYMIIVESKDPDNAEHNHFINDYLIENDCKLQFYYTDITINIDKVKNPFSSVLNSMFLQLDPTLVQKKNVYFANYHLYDDKLFIHFSNVPEKEMIKTGLSRTEDYSVYKGLNRTYEKIDDYNNYAKIYIRLDNRKVEIKRRYQDFFEFYADNSSILISLYYLFSIIFSNYDRTKANHSISKKLFYFEGTKNNNFERLHKLKELINSTEKENDLIPSQPNKKMGNAISDKKKKLSSPIIQIEDNKEEEEEKEIEIINYNPKTEDKIPQNKSNTIINLKKEENKENKEEDLVDYSTYNILEMFASLSFICKTKNFNNKLFLMEKSKALIDAKLDIVFYIRNMFLLELTNKIYLENKTIISFLTRPIIYLNEEEEKSGFLDDIKTDTTIELEDYKKKKEEEEKKAKENGGGENLRRGMGEIYKSAYKLNSDILSRKIKNLIRAIDKTETDNKIINILKEHLKGV